MRHLFRSILSLLGITPRNHAAAANRHKLNSTTIAGISSVQSEIADFEEVESCKNQESGLVGP
jgi:hypothetical protein